MCKRLFAAASLISVLVPGVVVAGEVEMRLDTVPSGATVEHAGRTLGRTPLVLKYPTGYFQERLTAFGAYLGAPLEFTFRLPGYETKHVKLGRGPYPWRNAFFVIVYQYYLLDRSYRIELQPERSPGATTSAPANDTLSQLERLATLRERGVLTEEEFQAQKRAILESGAVNATAATPAPTYLDSEYLLKQDLSAFCPLLLHGAIPGSANLFSEDHHARTKAGRHVVALCNFTAPAKGIRRLVIRVICEGRPAEEICSDAGKPITNSQPLRCAWESEAGRIVEGVIDRGCRVGVAMVEGAAPPGQLPGTGVKLMDILTFAAGQV